MVQFGWAYLVLGVRLNYGQVLYWRQCVVWRLAYVKAKRKFCKDTGAFCQHGGLLDRVDSLLLTVPAFTVFLLFEKGFCQLRRKLIFMEFNKKTVFLPYGLYRVQHN